MVIVDVLCKLIEWLAAPVYNYLSYFCCYKRNVNDLRKEVDNDLSNVEADIKSKVGIAKRKGEEVHKVVTTWLDKVETIRTQWCTLCDGEEETTRKEFFTLEGRAANIGNCFNGWCCARYHLGKEAKKRMGEVIKLVNEGTNFNTVSDPSLLPNAAAEDFISFKSRLDIKNQILTALRNDNTHIIGVYGMGGIGKTTLMNELWNEVENEKLFEKVVKAIVSQNPVVKRIETEIAESLGMPLKDDSISARAIRLSARLKQEKTLIILDDFWDHLSLETVGIPNRDQHRGCKVVFTTRSQEVCNSMGSGDKFEVKVISGQESIELFLRSCGDVGDNPFAEQIAIGCKGLPLAIITLAKALRGKNNDIWAEALRKLKNSSSSDNMAPVISSIEMRNTALYIVLLLISRRLQN